MNNYLLGADKIPYMVDTTTTEGLIEWAKEFNIENRKVDRTHFGRRGFVSTVFLGMDHRFWGGEYDDPILFETMCFANDWREQFTRRYSFWPEAVEGHAEVVKEFAKYLRENGSRNQREGRYMDRMKTRRNK